MRKTIASEKAPSPIGPYSQAVLTNGTLYCSGQIAVGRLDSGIAGQTCCVCENIAAILDSAGMSLENVVKTTCFLADMADFASFNESYEKYFSHKPARSCVAVKGLPKDARIEIEVIAVANTL
jgi:reactive intermediate/imine deaminase